MHNESEFYVGYLPMPARLRAAIRKVVLTLGIATAVVTAVLIAGQNSFAPSQFEFQQYREFQGTLLNEPYPSLLISGQGSPWLLVGPGKHVLLHSPLAWFTVPTLEGYDAPEVKLHFDLCAEKKAPKKKK